MAFPLRQMYLLEQEQARAVLLLHLHQHLHNSLLPTPSHLTSVITPDSLHSFTSVFACTIPTSHPPILNTRTRPTTMAPRPSTSAMKHEIVSMSLLYRIFFLYIEPLSTIIGAYYAFVLPRTYLELTHLSSAPLPTTPVPTSSTVVLAQLANLYFLFALNEGLVLRATSDLRVWKTLLFGLLIADLGHLFSVREVGYHVYWRFWTWNAIDAGNVGFVYAGAITRIMFLSGVGVAAVPVQTIALKVKG